MPTYLSPGVYVEEVEAGSRPIEGVGTAVAAFVGLAAKGPLNEATLVTNWGQFTQTFGEFTDGAYLAHAVYGYFMNGGGACYVVRVGGDGNGSSPARGEGASEDQFKLVVRRDGQPVEEYDKASTKKGRQNVVQMVNAASKLIRLEEMAGAPLDKPAKATVNLAGGGAPPAP